MGSHLPLVINRDNTGKLVSHDVKSLIYLGTFDAHRLLSICHRRQAMARRG